MLAFGRVDAVVEAERVHPGGFHPYREVLGEDSNLTGCGGLSGHSQANSNVPTRSPSGEAAAMNSLGL